MDIVESIDRFLAGAECGKGSRSRLTKARDEIVRLREEVARLSHPEALVRVGTAYNYYTKRGIS